MNSSDLKCTEGIILHMIPYQNYDQILTVFTPEEGVLKFFCKKAKTKSQRFSPLTKVEVIYKEKNSELYACEEITPLQTYHNLRTNFSHLQVGCELVRAIHTSQFVGKAAPLLYQLLMYYLEKIPLVKDPYTLSAGFKLKILKHEGVLNDDPQSYHLKLFSMDELALLDILTHGQSYQQLSQLSIPVGFNDKIEKIFQSMIRN
ncbi:MAG: DNA repair protein RecO [Parachlamydiaceae bacterium]|nr:DNA repair protein RecO [Parachlamydiaceae bacterium]